MKIEKGEVIEIQSPAKVDSDFNVLINFSNCEVSIGKINKPDLKWFDASPNPNWKEIQAVVYLGDYSFGLKQLTHRFEEFELLNTDQKEDILCSYLESLTN